MDAHRCQRLEDEARREIEPEVAKRSRNGKKVSLTQPGLRADTTPR